MTAESALTTALGSGFGISIALIAAIGAQNVFVIRQGLTGRYILPVVVFCASSDTILMLAGIFGLGSVLDAHMAWLRPWLFGGVALWLLAYGLLRLKSALKYFGQSNAPLPTDEGGSTSLKATLIPLAAVTWLNPHVYLDTVILVGALSLPYSGAALFAYAIGAISASWAFFFLLGYAAKAMSVRMQSSRAWGLLDLAVAVIMTLLAISMLRQAIV